MTTDMKTTVKEYFTDDEWDAIDAALGDYQDYGATEGELCYSVRNKIMELFN